MKSIKKICIALGLFGIISLFGSTSNQEIYEEPRPKTIQINNFQADENKITFSSNFSTPLDLIIQDTTGKIYATDVLQAAEKVSEKTENKNSENLYVSQSFGFIPHKSIITIRDLRDSEKAVSKELETEVIKTIIVDRDNSIEENGKLRPMPKIYVLEGNPSNPFGRIVKEEIVATGRKEKPTPLGYFTIHDKSHFLGYAVWFYEDWGIHVAPPGTNFGTYQSGGCVRTPYNTMKFVYDWTSKGTPTIIIGNKYKFREDSKRFDIRDYETIRTLIQNAEELTKQINLEQCSIYPLSESNSSFDSPIMLSLQKKIIESCKNRAIRVSLSDELSME
jgi:predicted nucleic-acid-binding protein